MLDIYGAPSLLAAIRSALNDDVDLQIDLGGVSRIHTAALQVLIAAVRSAHALGRSVSFEGISVEVAAMCRQSGLDVVLHLASGPHEVAGA